MAVLVTGMAASAVAQGQVRGIVTDEDGNGIPDATVTAENRGSARSLTDTTNLRGRFSFIGLRRGQWLFVIQAEGFKPVQGYASVRSAGGRPPCGSRWRRTCSTRGRRRRACSRG